MRRSRRTPSTVERNDELVALVPVAVDGDAAAIDRFITAVAPVLLRVIRQVLGPSHSDVEDVAQDAAFAVMEALPGFRGECTVLHFAARVALLTALNARRRLQLRERLTPAVSADTLEHFSAGDPSPSADLMAARRQRIVQQLLNELPAGQAEALAMHCVLGYTLAETALACGVPANTVRSRLGAAKSALKQRLSGDPHLAEELREPKKGAS